MVHHGVEVGLEGAHGLLARLLPREHVEVVRGVSQPQVGRHGLLPAQQPPVRGHDGGKGGHERERLGAGFTPRPEAQRPGGHAQRVHAGRSLCGRSPQQLERGPRKSPPPGERLPEGRQLARIREGVVPQ